MFVYFLISIAQLGIFQYKYSHTKLDCARGRNIHIFCLAPKILHYHYFIFRDCRLYIWNFMKKTNRMEYFEYIFSIFFLIIRWLTKLLVELILSSSPEKYLLFNLLCYTYIILLDLVGKSSQIIINTANNNF